MKGAIYTFKSAAFIFLVIGISPTAIHSQKISIIERGTTPYATHDDEVQVKLNHKMQVALSAFATIIAGAINIMQNPKNPDVIGEQVGAIAQGLIKVGVEASKSLYVHATPDEIHELTQRLTCALEDEITSILRELEYDRIVE